MDRRSFLKRSAAGSVSDLASVKRRTCGEQPSCPGDLRTIVVDLQKNRLGNLLQQDSRWPGYWSTFRIDHFFDLNDLRPADVSAAPEDMNFEIQASVPPKLPGFHIMTKPVGPICNLDCKYCFYLEKENLYPGHSDWKMPEKVLETCVRQSIEAQSASVVSFAWQGGEPTLLGVDYFRKAVEFQTKYAGGRRICRVGLKS
jgi:hypothetical protein